MEILLGIDVGSTTVKVAAVDARSRQLLYSDYRRHHAEQRRCLRELLTEVARRYPAAELRAAACGSGAKTIADQLGIGFVQEVVANAVAIKALHPQARTAIELGGQDAKIIFFHHDPATEQLIASDMRMNGVCAGGTGAFIDEIAALLQIPVDEFNGFAERGQQVYQVSGRCGVFAKTDLQPLLNQGVNKADLARSTLHAVVKQTIGGLAQGSTIRAPVVFEGGPLTFNPYLVHAFAEHLDLAAGQIIIPERPEVVVAHGCALAIDSILGDRASVTSADRLLATLSTAAPSAHGDQAQPAQPLFADDAERDAFLERHALPEAATSLPSDRSRLEVYLGIDAGSTTSKLVLLDTQGRLVYSFYANNEGQPLEVLRAALLQLREHSRQRRVELVIRGVGTTGYGEQLVAAAFRADHHAVETVAHARAALEYEPRASFVLDIGGQDMKAMFVHDGVITGITLNEACSSGCGAFIETFADSLEVPVERIAEHAFRSRQPAQLGSRCTVFMRSQVITEQKNRKTPEDILAGLCRSVVQNVFTKVLRLSNLTTLGGHIVVQGGTFRNDAVLRALESYAQVEVTRAPYPELMGAIGIALLTRERLEQQPAATSFIGLEQLEAFAYQEHPGQRCPFCQNHCNRTVVSFAGGGHYVQGNRCERGEIVGELSDPAIRQRVRAAKQRIDSVPNLVAERERLLFRDYPVTAVSPPRQAAIGIPRALETWIRLPFWKGLFRALGFEVVVSAKSSYPLYESGLETIPSDTVCFPAKLAHGHVLDLIERGVERIFMPILLTTPAERASMDADYPCAVLSGYASVIRTNIVNTPPVSLDTPTFVWNDIAMRNAQLVDYLHTTFGIAAADSLKAIREADGCQQTFRATLQQRGAEASAFAREQGGFAVVLAARPYHGDELVNHGAASYFTRLGIPVMPVDAVPGLDEVDLDHVRAQISSNVQASMYAAATIAAADPHLELVQIVSFGCGHDAVISDELQRIVQDAGKSMLLLKLDESDVKGPLRLRITSFVNTVLERRKSRPERPTTAEAAPARFGRDDRQQRTIYIPNLSPGFSRVMATLVAAGGYRTETLPLADARALELGKRYVHNDICFPAQVNIGEFLRACELHDLSPESIAFGMHQNCKACRAGQYADLARKALDEAGFQDVPIITTGDPNGWHSVVKLRPDLKLKFVWCLAILDALEDMLRSTRAYERQPGAAQATFDRSLDALCAAMTGGVGALFRALEQAIEAFNRVAVDDSRKKPLVVLLGEIMVAVHPTSNYRIERYLEQQGMEVMTTRLSDFFHQGFLKNIEERANYHARPSLLATAIDRVGDTLFEQARRRTERRMAGYLRYRPRASARDLFLGASPHLALVHTIGEGWLILGEILHAAEQGVHSFVVVQPFGCMPNHVMGRGMIRAVKERYPLVQVLPLDFDPDTSLGNIENRLQMLIMNARELDARRRAGLRPDRSGKQAGRLEA